jgi:DNA polymerase III delta prime subunit
MKCEIKYAPQNLDEVIYPNMAVERRIKGYGSGVISGHVMLYGPNGTGKTTTAKLLINAIGGPDALLDNNSYEDLLSKPNLREYLLNSAALARMTTSGKYFLLLNEFDNAKKNLSKFWTALDDCGEDVMVIITTNYAMEIDRSIRSRFDMIEIAGVTAIAALPRVQYALRAEGLSLPDKQVLEYLKRHEHLMDLRKYFKVADELLYLRDQNLPFPAWSAAAPSFKIV